MNSDNNSKPAAGICAYNHFDPETFLPLNKETEVRMQELDFLRGYFKGKTVLDIGCNAGFQSFLVALLGAIDVHAIDVKQELIDPIRKKAEEIKLPIRAEVKRADQLRWEVDAADIVICFEVLHWIVSQGTPLPKAIEIIASVTKEIVLIETPWNVSEPSIQAQTKLTAEEYDISLIFEELSRYFEHVEFHRFMHYFEDPKSRRVLISARNRKIGSLLKDILKSPVKNEVPVLFGQNLKWRITTDIGDTLVKKVPVSGRFWSLSEDLLDNLFDHLRNSSKMILAPEKVNNSVFIHTHTGRFITRKWLETSRKINEISLDEHLSICISLTAELSRIDRQFICELQGTSLSFLHVWKYLTTSIRTGMASGILPEQDLKAWIKVQETLNVSDCTQLFHGDLHLANILFTSDGLIHVIDLETMSLGSAYTDLFFVLAFCDADLRYYEPAIKALQLECKDLLSPTKKDLVFAIGIVISWLLDTAPRLSERLSESSELFCQRKKVLSGLNKMSAWGLAFPH